MENQQAALALQESWLPRLDRRTLEAPEFLLWILALVCPTQNAGKRIRPGARCPTSETREVSENGQGQKGPQDNAGGRVTGSCCAVNHCVASSYSSGAAAAFPAAVGTALGKGEQRGAWGPILGVYLGGGGGRTEITMLRQLQEELFEMGSVSWVASQLRVMHQSSRRKQPERRKGWMRSRSKSEGLMPEIRQPARGSMLQQQLGACTAPRACVEPEFKRLRGPWREAQFWGLWGPAPLVFHTYMVWLYRVAGKKGHELLPIAWAWDMTVYPSAAHNMKTWGKVFEGELFLPYSWHSSWF